MTEQEFPSEEETRPETLTLSLELSSGLDAREVERRAMEAHRAGDVGRRVTAFYLADLADRGLHQLQGFASLKQYAKQRMRMAVSTFNEYVRVGRALRELPELNRLFAEGKLCWSRVRKLVRVATEETQLTWGEWAVDKTVEEVTNMVKRREKGQLPTDPERRTIHTTMSIVNARLNPVEQAVWSLYREALEEKVFGEPVSDRDMLLWAAHKGLRELSDQPMTLRPARTDLDPLNQDPALPFEQRDSPTGSKMRLKVLERDGGRCVSCGSRRNLSAHHMHWRRYGGKTVPENLVTLCEDCHSLVHDRFLVLQGEVTGLTFLDAEGRSLSERLPAKTFELKAGYDSEAAARAAGSATATRLVTFKDVPREVDADWWHRHRHLFSWNDRTGGLEFDPGAAPVSSPPNGDESAGEVASVPCPLLDDLVGQEPVRDHLRVAIQSAQGQGEPLDPVLLSGPSGLGKTSLARAIARELGGHFHSVMAPVIRDPAPLVRHLTSLEPGSVLFLDEVHRLPPRATEVLYDALEGGILDLPVRCAGGWEQRTLRIRLAPFTMVAATTREDRLLPPLRNRFVYRKQMEFYSDRELGEILTRAATEHGLELTSMARDQLAAASRDTPREALALLQAACDEARAAGSSGIDPGIVSATLARTGTTPSGVSSAETTYLRVLAGAGGPLGLSTLAARLGVSRRTVQRVYEQFPLRKGMVRLTPRGRCLTTQGSIAVAA